MNFTSLAQDLVLITRYAYHLLLSGIQLFLKNFLKPQWKVSPKAWEQLEFEELILDVIFTCDI